MSCLSPVHLIEVKGEGRILTLTQFFSLSCVMGHMFFLGTCWFDVIVLFPLGFRSFLKQSTVFSNFIEVIVHVYEVSMRWNSHFFKPPIHCSRQIKVNMRHNNTRQHKAGDQGKDRARQNNETRRDRTRARTRTRTRARTRSRIKTNKIPIRCQTGRSHDAPSKTRACH